MVLYLPLCGILQNFQFSVVEQEIPSTEKIQRKVPMCYIDRLMLKSSKSFYWDKTKPTF